MNDLIKKLSIDDIISVLTAVFMYSIGIAIIINDFRTGKSQESVTVWVLTDVPRATYTAVLCVVMTTFANYFRLILSLVAKNLKK